MEAIIPRRGIPEFSGGKRYQQVAYIQSTGTQYLKIPIPNSSSYDFTLIGSTNLQQSEQFYALGSDKDLYTYVEYYPGQVCFRAGTASERWASGITANTMFTFRMVYTGGSTATLYINGTSKGTVNASSASSTSTMTVFTRYENPSRTANGMRISRIYGTIGSKTFDYKAAYRISDGVAGLWDEANDEFITNAASGTDFIIGEPVE